MWTVILRLTSHKEHTWVSPFTNAEYLVINHRFTNKDPCRLVELVLHQLHVLVFDLVATTIEHFLQECLWVSHQTDVLFIALLGCEAKT